MLAAVAASAGTVSTSFTGGQDTYIQTVLIPEANARRCASYGLPASCSSGQVVAAGCVAAPFSAVTKRSLVYRSCEIFSSDMAGEDAFISDEIYQQLLAVAIAKNREADVNATCAAFGGASGANQDAACAAIGRPAGCLFCR